MVKDKHNQVYNDLITYLRTIYPDLSGGTEYADNPTKFPYVYFFQVDGSTRLTTLSQTEDGVETSYQIEVYAKGSNKSRQISNVIREYMVENGFFCRRFRPAQGASNVSRFLAIYERLDV